MKKIIAVVAIILVIGGFILFRSLRQNSDDAMIGATQAPLGNSQTNVPLPGGTPSGSITYKDGTYTGAVGSASAYGDIQVKVVISGGKITDIEYLQFPSVGGHTKEVTAMAEPILKQEAIAAQSANVNIVSGATQDTQGFIQSLQSALDQAKS